MGHLEQEATMRGRMHPTLLAVALAVLLTPAATPRAAGAEGSRGQYSRENPACCLLADVQSMLGCTPSGPYPDGGVSLPRYAGACTALAGVFSMLCGDVVCSASGS